VIFILSKKTSANSNFVLGAPRQLSTGPGRLVQYLHPPLYKVYKGHWFGYSRLWVPGTSGEGPEAATNPPPSAGTSQQEARFTREHVAGCDVPRGKGLVQSEASHQITIMKQQYRRLASRILGVDKETHPKFT